MEIIISAYIACYIIHSTAQPTFVVKEVCPKWLIICSFISNFGSTQSRRIPQMNSGVEFLTIRDCNQQSTTDRLWLVNFYNYMLLIMLL